jgi:hypothetical protein
MNLEFSGPVWHWKGPAPWYFITVPDAECASLQAISGAVTYGWGMIPVNAEVGQTRWATSLWPKDGRYIVPLKANVRRAEGLAEGDVARVRLSIKD